VSAAPLRVLWVCGAPGAGKSAAAWALSDELAETGWPVAYVDIDQLGMLYPETDDDLGRHVLKADALSALAPGYEGVGADVLVVSGVVDARTGPALAADLDVTTCLLSPGAVAVRERVLARGCAAADAEDAVAEDLLLRGASFVDHVVDSTGLSVADTVARLRPLVGGHGRPAPPRSPPPATGSDVPVVVVTGPRAAGSSTIGFGLATRSWGASRRTGFVDLQQLGFLAREGRVTTDVPLATGQLAAMHRLMAGRGAERLVVTAHLDVRDHAVLRAALPAAPVTVLRLRADESTLGEHVRSRVRGGGPRLAGDDLLGSGQEHQDQVVAQALAEQEALDAAGLDDVVLDVGGRGAEEVLDELATARLA
jgi:hypothetical protein